MTRIELERHLGEYVEVILFDGTVIEGILHKTGEKAFENDPNLTIPKLRYFCTYGDNVVDRCVFKLSHIKKISRIKIKIEKIDNTAHAKWEFEGIALGYADYKCARCGNFIFFDNKDNDLYNYCPYCGAKMEGKGDEK